MKETRANDRMAKSPWRSSKFTQHYNNSNSENFLLCRNTSTRYVNNISQITTIYIRTWCGNIRWWHLVFVIWRYRWRSWLNLLIWKWTLPLAKSYHGWRALIWFYHVMFASCLIACQLYDDWRTSRSFHTLVTGLGETRQAPSSVTARTRYGMACQ